MPALHKEASNLLAETCLLIAHSSSLVPHNDHVAVSLSIDALINLLRSGRVERRERIETYLQAFVDQSDQLAHAWIDLCAAARKRPGTPWGVTSLKAYFETIDPGRSIQLYCHVSFKAMYKSLSVAMAGRLPPPALEVIANKAARVLEARMWLRGWYDYRFSQSVTMIPTDEELSEMDKLLAILLERVADLRAVVAAMKAAD